MKGLGGDLAARCASRGWEFSALGRAPGSRLDRAVPLGDRTVRVDLVMGPSRPDSTRVLRGRIEAPGAGPLVRTFPRDRRGGADPDQ